MRTANRGLSPDPAFHRKRLAAALAVAGLFAGARAADAQVLEVGAGGAVVIHDRPAVFDGVGECPIAVPRARLDVVSETAPLLVSEAAKTSDMGEDLIAAVAWTESRMRASAVSKAGARGEMQLMPSTARAFGVDPGDSRQNYRGGAAYLRRLLIRYDGDLVKSLAAYNAGPGAVDRYGGVPPYAETRAYVAAVLDRLSRAVETPK